MPPVTRAITDPQIGFAFHDYCGFAELRTYLGTPEALQLTCDAQHALTWRNAHRVQARTRLPMLATEFGNIDDGEELERSLSRSDAAFTGWQYWHYGTFSPGQLRHLVRTYPTATAGTPVSLRFDPTTGTMRYRYRPRPGVTEIAVSDVHYPDGYRVKVTGGHVTSMPGASLISVVATPGAVVTTVSVTRR